MGVRGLFVSVGLSYVCVKVFGSKLLARDLEAAAHFSREYKLDAITKEVMDIIGQTVTRTL